MADKLTRSVRNATNWKQVGDCLGISAEAARARAYRAGLSADFDHANFRAIIATVPVDERVDFLLDVVENMQARHSDHEVDNYCPDLKPQERRVMALLYDRRGKICPHDTIFEICWSHKIAMDEIPEPQIVKVIICGLRRKIPGNWRIKNVWGRGYILETT